MSQNATKLADPRDPAAVPPPPMLELRHFHYDHLGSLQVMTTAGGSAAQYIRYKPFGEERGRFNAALEPANPNAPLGLSKYSFTGYEQDGRTGLQYANARWYDPELGQFATHDPKRQFDSPYNYGAWDPTNLTDPSGEFVEPFTAFLFIAAVAAGIDAGIQTGDPVEGLKAFGINLGISALGYGVGSVVGPMLPAVSPTLKMTANLSLGTYGVVNSVRNGAYVSAAVTYVNMVYSAHGIMSEQSASSAPKPGRSGGSVGGFESSIMDRAAEPTWGEYQLDLAERGIGEAKADVEFYGSDRVRGAQEDLEFYGGQTRVHAEHLVDYNTGLPNARIYGQSMIGYPQGGIDIGAPAFASYEAYVRTYIDELGHVGHSTFHSRLFDIGLHFETTEFGYLRDRKLGSSR